ncbi:MAG: rod shape-determining protein RodA [Actinomycetota bacterium]|jgi:rod shape determining protein RodA
MALLEAVRRRPSLSGMGNIRSSMADPSRNIDWLLVFAVAALSTIGAFAVYSTTRPRLLSRGVDPYYLLQRQIIYIIAAAVVMALVMAVDYEWLRGRAEFLYGASLVALMLVLVAGAVRGGARLSFDLGIVSLQPAEFTKFSLLLLLAGYLSEEENDELPYHRFIMTLVIVGSSVGLVLLQPDLGSATVLLACTMGLLLVAGSKVRYIVSITSLAILSATVAAWSGVVRSYQFRRFEAFLNQNSTEEALKDVVLQVRFAKRAVATGGITGKGFLNGPLTNGAFIPVQSTDFIFSAIAEQFGLIGAGVTLSLFTLLMWRIWRIGRLSRTRLGQFIALGAFSMILWQTFQNIGMTLGIMPVSGLPLPFISYGGSHMVAFAAIVGLVQSVHMRRLR